MTCLTSKLNIVLTCHDEERAQEAMKHEGECVPSRLLNWHQQILGIILTTSLLETAAELVENRSQNGVSNELQAMLVLDLGNFVRIAMELVRELRQVKQVHVLYICLDEALDLSEEDPSSLLRDQLEQLASQSERRGKYAQEHGLSLLIGVG